MAVEIGDLADQQPPDSPDAAHGPILATRRVRYKLALLQLLRCGRNDGIVKVGEFTALNLGNCNGAPPLLLAVERVPFKERRDAFLLRFAHVLPVVFVLRHFFAFPCTLAAIAFTNSRSPQDWIHEGSSTMKPVSWNACRASRLAAAGSGSLMLGAYGASVDRMFKAGLPLPVG